jgi:hypothetical protein
MTDLFASRSSLLLRRADYMPVLQVNCVVSRSLVQEHGYRNAGGMGKLEGAEELAYDTYPTLSLVQGILTLSARHPFKL